MGLVSYPTLTTTRGTLASSVTLTVGRALTAYIPDVGPVDLAFLTEAGDYLTAETGDLLLTA